MKHIFIVNPVSGKGKAANAYVPVIEEYIKKTGLDAEIYITKASRDGMRFVEETAKKGEPVRFYSCGGDGTLYEVVNGRYKYKNCQVACVPLGSGNDFIRLFGKNTNIDDIVNGEAREFDLILTDGKVAINQCSMGIDAEICAQQANFKKLPLVNGEVAYDLGALYCIMGKLKNEFKITIDDTEVFEDTYLFCYIGNSRWYGGGYKAAPLAMPNDGLLDFVMVRLDRGRLKLLPLIGKYKKGEHLDWDITTFKRGKKITVESKKTSAVNVDGECDFVTKRTFEILEKGITYIVPRGSEFLEDKTEDEITVK